MAIVLVTGAGSGIGSLTAHALAYAGHTSVASMRDIAGRNHDRAAAVRATAEREGLDLHVIELDVASQDSADNASAEMIQRFGGIDAVVHNAGHLSLGYTEAYTSEEIAQLFDVNALGLHRVNRAVLPIMRNVEAGTLVYVGSTTTVSVPPFLGPYVASKFAFDALAQTTAYEVSQFGIETVIVMPGAFTHGTEHFANAVGPGDKARAEAYERLDWMVQQYDQATQGLYSPGTDPDPSTVADEIVRILALPVGMKPFRTVVDFTRSDVAHVNEVARASVEDFLTRMGFSELLHVRQ